MEYIIYSESRRLLTTDSNVAEVEGIESATNFDFIRDLSMALGSVF